MQSNIRKWIGLLIAVLCYYILHEGSHLVIALLYGTFEKVRIVFPGVQVVSNIEGLSNFEIAMFSVSGSISTLIVGYLLIVLRNKIVRLNNKYVLAILFYTTLVLLMCDPIYVSLLSGIFGGGDVNGIILFGISAIAVKMIFGIIGLVNLFIFIKAIYPKYKDRFRELST
jgi:hypothetical protein